MRTGREFKPFAHRGRRAVAAILTEKGDTELEAAEPPEEGDATLPSA